MQIAARFSKNALTHRKRIALRPITISLATSRDRAEIYRARHHIYARELQQHPVNDLGCLSDSLDDRNIFVIARSEGELGGFISITPPGESYSIDKYFARTALPFPVNRYLYEVRLLSVLKAQRGSDLAALLMYAAFRWVESHGGDRIMVLGRREILDLYLKVGLARTGMEGQSGMVTYELLHASLPALRERLDSYPKIVERLAEKTDWKLHFPFCKSTACFHGGSFFKAIGERFDSLEDRADVINADVLDAWFPPSPKALAVLERHLPWLLQTSPPADCAGLIEVIAEVRGVEPANILPGAGSSDLIFRVLRQWLTPASHALVLDPTYGEYAHVLENVIGCTLDRLSLSRADNYKVSLERLEVALQDGYDLVVLVNPNSPTGQYLGRDELEAVLRRVPQQTRVWVDETYLEYVGAEQSLEQFAARSENVLVCKSMSKTYALSGARVAYLCAGQHQLEELRTITPPWVVNLPAQAAAVEALHDPSYYQERYEETHKLRDDLANKLEALGWDVIHGAANFLLCHLPDHGPDAASLIRACQEKHLYLRDAATMGAGMGERAIRLAVKDGATNSRMLEIITDLLAQE
ncbi:MAG: histidinol-phosphate aminotransferase family protein [Chthoniobacterales bacterium]|nr:histidinol-phosphate aminotransferase family protein [Chthoniobacterales bacterium]